MPAFVHVYVSNFETTVIPKAIVEEAERLNNGKNILDRRTRGGKVVARWERETEAKLKAVFDAAHVEVANDKPAYLGTFSGRV